MKSAYQIASDIVDAWPYSVNVKSSHKMLLVAVIAESLSEQRQEGYTAGYAACVRYRLEKTEETT